MSVAIATAVGVVAGGMLAAGTVSAATTPTRNADVVAQAFIASAPGGSVTNSSFTTIPAAGDPAGVSDSKLASFPLNGKTFAILSTGNVSSAELPDDSNSTGTNNGGGNGGHGNAVNDLVTLKLDLNVPQNRNCLTFDFRFLSEEFPEYVGSQFNDGFVAEIDTSDFQVSGNGDVSAPNNIAQDENGKVVTVNTSGTSADNALGTTYDGATPILSGTTPIEPGEHALYLSIYDASDGIFDSAVFLDNLRLLNTQGNKCKKGATPIGGAKKCQGKEPTVIASDGVATGTQGDDVISGSSKKDKIRGRGGDDLICGRGGDDEISGNDGEDEILGNSGEDLIRGNSDDDNLGGGSGDDEVFGRGGDDRVRGGKDDDRLKGNGGDDLLRGNKGDDRVSGNRGDDDVRGNGGKNKCSGGPGNDTIGVGC